MSDMSQLYKAYAAVHNKDIKTELTESKDEISGMNLNSLMSSDLIEITEEIVESMFESGFDVKDTNAVITHIFESAQSGFVTEVRQNKIERLQEAFYKTFQKVTEKSPKIAVEAFINYRNQKPLVEKWDNRVSHEFDNSKTHKSLVAEDRKRVLDGLMDMVLRGMDEVFNESSIVVSPGGKMGRDDKSSMDAHGKAGNMSGSIGRKREDEKNKRMSSAAKDPLKKQQEMNRAGRPGLDRIGTAIKSVQDKKEVDADKAKTDAEKRRAKLKKKFGKSINAGMREEWASAYVSIYEKKLAAPDHDPVGQEDKDIDNDGDHDKTDKYLLNRRKVIGKAITTRKEEVEIDEATAMAKRGYDETKLRKPAGGGAAADRATALEKKPTYGNDKAAKQRSDYARKQRGDFRKTASSSPGLHGYGHKSDDPKVKAKQAARGAQRGALTPNEKKELNREEVQFSEAELKAIQAKVDSWDIEESQYARNNPEKYEREARKTETSGQKAERRVRDRLKTMDPERAEAMKKQMRAVGLDV